MVCINKERELHNGIGTSANEVLPSFKFCMIWFKIIFIYDYVISDNCVS